MTKVHLGFDDTDSPEMGCTTYIAALLVERLEALGVRFLDYPNLIRLNPNVPWKTRGNGAICLRFSCGEHLLEEILWTAVDVVEENSDLKHEKTEPGIVLFTGDVPRELADFSKRAIRGVVSVEEALSLIGKFGAEAVGFKGGRGIIGGLAAIGETLTGDHTYELLAYRTPENRGTPRRVDAESVVEMDRRTSPYTFNNVDPETGRILITPHGPDPVLYGIRGESAEVVKEAHKMVRVGEEIERWVIFRTNQGTDMHLTYVDAISKLRPYHPAIVRGEVVGNPTVIPGGHVFFQIRDDSGSVQCAAFEPTGVLNRVARSLAPGDLVEVYGGVKPPSNAHPLTLNLEKMRVLRLAPKEVRVNPRCPKCGRRMESMGAEKGFRCRKCGHRDRNAKKVVVRVERKLKPGLYITSPRSQRHLTKPLRRYGMEKSGSPSSMIDGWHS